MIPYGDYPDHTAIKKILVIKLRHHGDVLLTSAVFNCLKKALPNAEINALIYGETLPMLEGHPAITTIHTYDGEWKNLSLLQKLAKEFSLVKQLREKHYDVVINLTEGDRGAITAWITGAPVRVGWDPAHDGFIGQKKVYSHIVKRPSKPRHMVEQNLDACRRMGIFPEPEERRLHIHIPERDSVSILKTLDKAGVRRGNYLLFHLTSRWLFKCWPLKKNRELVQAIQQRGIPIVLSAAPDDMELQLVDRILQDCDKDGILDLSGKLSLKELAALIEYSKGLVTIDSVPMHIASALKKPTVALFGPSSEEAWGPWKNPNAKVIAADFSCRPCNLDGCGGGKVSDCLASITVEEVLRAIDQVFVDTAD